MNAQVESAPLDLDAALRTAHMRLADTRRQLAALDARVTVATASVAEAAATLEERQSEKTAMLARRSQQIENWWATGHTGSPPSVVPDLAAETRLLTSETTLQASRTALDSIRAVREATAAATQRTGAEIATLVEAVLVREDEARAQQVLALSDQLITIGRQLQAGERSGAHVPLNLIRLGQTSPLVEQALEVTRRLQTGRDLHTRVDLVRGLTDGLVAEREQLAARRAELIAGTEAAT